MTFLSSKIAAKFTLQCTCFIHGFIINSFDNFYEASFRKVCVLISLLLFSGCNITKIYLHRVNFLLLCPMHETYGAMWEVENTKNTMLTNHRVNAPCFRNITSLKLRKLNFDEELNRLFNLSTIFQFSVVQNGSQSAKNAVKITTSRCFCSMLIPTGCLSTRNALFPK